MIWNWRKAAADLEEAGRQAYAKRTAAAAVTTGNGARDNVLSGT